MFHSCTSLKKSPVLNATELISSSCMHMFYGCTSLDTVIVKFKDWHKSAVNEATCCWLGEVAKSGTFIAPSDLTVERGESRIPYGWTKIDLPSETNAANVRPNFQDEPEEEEVSSIAEQPIDNPEKEESYLLSGQRTTNKQGLIIKNGKLQLVK